MVPTGKRETVVEILDDEEIDYVITDETSGREYVAVVSFPLPTPAVEPVLTRLRDGGIGDDAYTVVVNAETVISRRFEALTQRYLDETEDPERIPREELAARAADHLLEWRTYAVMTVISALVATAGLLLDSPAVVVGSMVIAPLLGPAMATSVGSVLDDHKLFLKGVRYQAFGGLLAVAAAATFAVLLRQTNAVPMTEPEVFALEEVSERLAPGILSLAVALGAGVAGALSVSTGASAALVGVMIAAALVPPTAVIGIGIAWWSPEAIVGSTVLVLVNILSINLTALAVLSYEGYRPRLWFREDEARLSTLKRIGMLVAAILVLSAFLVGVSYGTYRTSAFEDETRQQIQYVLDEHPTLSLLSMEVAYSSRTSFRYTERVTVTLGHRSGTDPPLVADEIAVRIDAAAVSPFELERQTNLTVEVRYIPIERRTVEEQSDG